MASLHLSIKRIGSQAIEKRWRRHLSYYESKRAFCCHGNQSFDPICPKTLCRLSPTPVMLHIKLDQDWPTSFRDIQVWKCGRRRTNDGPLVYYKLTLWAFDSGELISQNLVQARNGVIENNMMYALNQSYYNWLSSFQFRWRHQFYQNPFNNANLPWIFFQNKLFSGQHLWVYLLGIKLCIQWWHTGVGLWQVKQWNSIFNTLW